VLKDINEALVLLDRSQSALNEDWQAKGRCAKHPDPDLWFAPVEDSSPRYSHLDGDALRRARLKDRGRAREMCRACPVRAECLRYSLDDQNGEFGMWGGLDRRDRTRLKDRLAVKEVAA
jgi:WhiB family redox-sensing transcriptional regulator